jgi:hypothetical protein
LLDFPEEEPELAALGPKPSDDRAEYNVDVKYETFSDDESSELSLSDEGVGDEPEELFFP